MQKSAAVLNLTYGLLLSNQAIKQASIVKKADDTKEQPSAWARGWSAITGGGGLSEQEQAQKEFADKYLTPELMATLQKPENAALLGEFKKDPNGAMKKLQEAKKFEPYLQTWNKAKGWMSENPSLTYGLGGAALGGLGAAGINGMFGTQMNPMLMALLMGGLGIGGKYMYDKGMFDPALKGIGYENLGKQYQAPGMNSQGQPLNPKREPSASYQNELKAEADRLKPVPPQGASATHAPVVDQRIKAQPAATQTNTAVTPPTTPAVTPSAAPAPNYIKPPTTTNTTNPAAGTPFDPDKFKIPGTK